MNLQSRLKAIENSTSYKYVCKITPNQASQLLTLRKERASDTAEFNTITSYLEGIAGATV